MPRPPRGTHTVRCTAPGTTAVGVYVIERATRGQAEARAVANFIAECAELVDAPPAAWRTTLAGHPLATPPSVPEWRDVVAEHIR